MISETDHQEYKSEAQLASREERTRRTGRDGEGHDKKDWTVSKDSTVGDSSSFIINDGSWASIHLSITIQQRNDLSITINQR